MNPWGFIAASYLVAGAVVVALIVWVAVDRRMITRRLAVLEARGVRRRSAAAPVK
jgi:heme exporter protein D